MTVNSSTADRKGEYFHKEISIGNSSGPVWQTVSVTAGGGTTNGGFAFPANSSTLTYDADGNLTFDGTWTYEWDPENRLAAMSMTNLAGIANSNRLRLEFTYDFQGQRVAKTVLSWNGSSYANPVTDLFVNDGWNLLVELVSPSSPILGFLWGEDLSGTQEGVGGIGGLLAALQISGGGTSNCNFTCYDGDGDVKALIRATDFASSARYDYSPFGTLIRATGPMASTNPFRFSTKYQDESSLINYGYRYYNPRLGRWLGTDPLGVSGGIHLYAFVANNPLNEVDALGQMGNLIDTGTAVTEGVEMDEADAGTVLGILQKVKAMASASNAYQRLGYAILGSGAGATAEEEYDAMESFLAEGNALVAKALQSGKQITTVLGKYSTDMNQFFDEGGRMNAWGRAWQEAGNNILSLSGDPNKAQQLSANFQWLAQAVARGDRIYMATKVAEEGGSTYPMEIQFLNLLGYVREGDYMVQK